MCRHVFTYNGKNKNTNSQANGSIKYILNTHEGVMQNKIYCNWTMINMYFRVFVIFNRWSV